MSKIECDFLIIGAGIIGMSIAYQLKKFFPKKKIVIIEKENDVGFHASGRNSGVLHAGFYYHPDSLKAKLTRIGNQELTEYCIKKGLKINKCGKVVVTKHERELETLFELKRRGDLNGVELYVIDEKELKELEPNAKTIQYALWSPTTSVVDPLEILNSLKIDLEYLGVSIVFNAPYTNRLNNNTVMAGNHIIEYDILINAAGLYADKIARDFGLGKEYILIPFKGLYLYYMGKERLIRRNIYPVPDIRNPFLGVHYTLTVSGKIKIGPSASPAFWRENYDFLERFNLRELLEVLRWNISLFLRNSLYRRTAIAEIKKYFKSKLVDEASKIVYSVGDRTKYVWGSSGIRAQLLHIEKFELVQDFVVQQNDNSIHVLNAVSPAFTACFPFARYIVENYILPIERRK